MLNIFDRGKFPFEVEWKRASELCDDPKFFLDGATRFDINQVGCCVGLRPGVLVWWLWDKTRNLKVVGSNPSMVYWMDIFSHWFVVKIVLIFL